MAYQETFYSMKSQDVLVSSLPSGRPVQRWTRRRLLLSGKSLSSLFFPGPPFQPPVFPRGPLVPPWSSQAAASSLALRPWFPTLCASTSPSSCPSLLSQCLSTLLSMLSCNNLLFLSCSCASAASCFLGSSGNTHDFLPELQKLATFTDILLELKLIAPADSQPDPHLAVSANPPARPPRLSVSHLCLGQARSLIAHLLFCTPAVCISAAVSPE